jgi:hypothetical protein
LRPNARISSNDKDNAGWQQQGETKRKAVMWKENFSVLQLMRLADGATVKEEFTTGQCPHIKTIQTTNGAWENRRHTS